MTHRFQHFFAFVLCDFATTFLSQVTHLTFLPMVALLYNLDFFHPITLALLLIFANENLNFFAFFLHFFRFFLFFTGFPA